MGNKPKQSRDAQLIGCVPATITELMRAVNEGNPIFATASSPVPGGAELDDLGLALPGLLFAAGAYAGQIGALAVAVSNDRRNRDWHTALLLRSLYEYVVTFCWLAADSTGSRAKNWADEDKRLRLATASELERVGGTNPLPAATAAKFSTARQNMTKPPSVEQQAKEADKHWCANLPAYAAMSHSASSNPGPLTDAYPLIYRRCSSIGHPTPQALQTCFVHPGRRSGGFEIGTTTGSSSRFFYTQAPMIFALALYVAGTHFSWVDTSGIDSAFGAWPKDTQ